MTHPHDRFSFTRNRMTIAGILLLGCALILGVWYWQWDGPRSLDELDPSRIPAEYRFEGQPPELVAVLTTKSAFIGTVGIAFSPDGKCLAGGFGNGEIVLWDVGRLKEIAAWKAHTLPVRALLFSSDGKTLISGSADKTIRLWDVSSRKPKERAVLRGHSDGVWSLALSPDGKTLVSGSPDESMRLWDLSVSPPQERRVVDKMGWSVWSVSIASDNRALASVRHKRIQVRDLEDEELNIKAIGDGHTDIVWRVTFAPDGKRLASCGRDTAVRLWELDGDRLRYRAAFHGHSSTDLYGLVFAPDGHALVSADEDGRVIVWDLDKRSERHRWQLPAGLRNVVFAPDGRHLAISTGSKDIVYILRLSR